MEFFGAVNLAALFGWMCAALPSAAVVVALPNGGLGSVPLTLLVAAVGGIPVAYGACWVIGAPILWRLMTRPITWRSAARWGVLIAVTMEVAAAVVLGLLQLSRDPQQIPTEPIEPFMLLAIAAGAIVALFGGLVIALTVRAIVGPGRPAAQ